MAGLQAVIDQRWHSGQLDYRLRDPTARVLGHLIPERIKFSLGGPRPDHDAFTARTVNRLDDQFGRAGQDLEQNLSNKGIQQGSEAYTNAMKDFNFGRNDAYQGARTSAIGTAGEEQARMNQMRLGNRQQGYQEAVQILQSYKDILIFGKAEYFIARYMRQSELKARVTVKSSIAQMCSALAMSFMYPSSQSWSAISSVGRC